MRGCLAGLGTGEERRTGRERSRERVRDEKGERGRGPGRRCYSTTPKPPTSSKGVTHWPGRGGGEEKEEREEKGEDEENGEERRRGRRGEGRAVGEEKGRREEMLLCQLEAASQQDPLGGARPTWEANLGQQEHSNALNREGESEGEGKGGRSYKALLHHS